MSKILAALLLSCVAVAGTHAAANPFCSGKAGDCKAAQIAAKLPPGEKRFAAACLKEMARLEAAGESVGGRTDPRCQKYYEMGERVAEERQNDPAGIVSAAIKLDRQNTPLFDDGPKGQMRTFFTKGFVAAWSVAMEKNKDEPFMDGDPVSGFQGLKWLALKSLKVESKSDTEASVTTTVLVQSDRSGPENIKFILRRESGAWKIDDIASPVEPSLHAYLVKSSH
jgi:hypothetical protein